MSILDAALDWHAAGCYVLPVKPGGSKAPAVQRWGADAPAQTADDVRQLFTMVDTDGLGLMCGAPSGELEMVEVESRGLGTIVRLGDLCREWGIGDLWEQLQRGYVEVTPSGGMHWLYRVADGRALPNTKLARRPGVDDEGRPKADVLWETRGTGGFVVTAPSNGRTHSSGRGWSTKSSPADIPTITADERDRLHEVARMLDEMPPPEPIGAPTSTPRVTDGLRPGDDFNQRVSWREILEPAGWTYHGPFGRGHTWRRPHKDTPGFSATTGTRGDGDNLYVFSSNAYPFEQEVPYSKFGAIALLHHHGDFSAAAKALRDQDFGDPLPPRAPDDWSDVIAGGLRPFVLEPGDVGYALSARDDSQTSTTESNGLPTYLEVEIEKLRVRREATRIVNAEEAEANFRPPTYLRTLTQELEIPDEPVSYLFDKIMPAGANVLLTAQYKTGKTTLVNQAAKAAADTLPFLGRFETFPIRGRVGLFNYEVDRRQYRRWLRDAGIDNTDAVSVLNLRGERLVLSSPRSQQWIIDWLREHEITLWIVDPFARAYVGSGKSENDNAEVGAFLDTLDYIKAQAGVESLIMPTHTGRGEMEQGSERARGATRLDDWADVRWILTRDDAGVRFLSATGRDVEVEEEKLTWHEGERRLTFGGGDRRWEGAKRLEEIIVQVVTEQPGISTAALQTAVRERAGGGVANTGGPYGKAYASAVSNHRIRVDEKGKGLANEHHPIH